MAHRFSALHDESLAMIDAAEQREAENELLLLQLHQLQEELETYFEQYQQSEKELEAQRRKNLEAAIELEEYFNQYHETDKKLSECNRVVEELAKVLEVRDRQNAELSDVVKHEREHLESVNEVLRQTRLTVSIMRQSKSWKLTAPLRWFLGIFARSDR